VGQHRRRPKLRPCAGSLFLRDARIGPGLGFAEAVQEQGVVGDGLLDELLEQEQFGTADDGMNAVLKGLERRKGLERVAEENDCGVPALTHRHVLERLQSQVLIDMVGRKQLLEDNDLIVDLAEANQEVGVSRGRVDL